MKEVTIHDIARQLKISASSVSRALSNNSNISSKTRKKVLETADAMGYTVNSFARNLRKGRNNRLIGVIFHKLNSQFSINVLYGIEKVASNAGYDMIICHSSESYEREIVNAANLFQRRVDGLIVGLSADVKSTGHFLKFVEKGIPVFLFDRVKEGFPGVKVVIDNFTAALQATTHLIEQGCKRIVHIAGNLESSVFLERLRGYKQALINNGITYNPVFVIYKNDDDDSDILSQQVLSISPLPDGVFAVNDVTAALCMKGLLKAGIKIPEDMAIIGFNNDPVTELIEPNLSTINYPGIEMGEVIAKSIIEAIQNKNTLENNYTIVLKSEIIERPSSLRS